MSRRSFGKIRVEIAMTLPAGVSAKRTMAALKDYFAGLSIVHPPVGGKLQPIAVTSLRLVAHETIYTSAEDRS